MKKSLIVVSALFAFESKAYRLMDTPAVEMNCPVAFTELEKSPDKKAAFLGWVSGYATGLNAGSSAFEDKYYDLPIDLDERFYEYFKSRCSHEEIGYLAIINDYLHRLPIAKVSR